MKIFTDHLLSIEDGSIAVETGTPGAPTGAAEPPAGESANPYSDRLDAMNSEERRHWKMTGEFPKAKSDAKPESSTGKRSESTSKEGSDATEAALDPADDKQPKGARASWSTLRERAAAAEAKAELLERQLADSRKTPVAATKEEPKAEAKPAAEGLKRPRLEDKKYSTIAEYDADMDKYEADRDTRNAQREEQRFREWQHQQDRKTRETSRSQQIEALEKAHPDYKAVAFNASVPASNAVLFHLENSPKGMELRYELGKNLAEAKRIADLTHVPGLDAALKALKPGESLPPELLGAFRMARSIAESELAKLAPSKAATEKTTVRRLPKPSTEVSVNGNSNGNLGDDEAQAIASGDVAAYKRLRNKREMDERRNR